MLSKFQKLCIDEIINTHTRGIITEAKAVKIPAFEDMFEKSLSQLKKLGFSVKHVLPKNANCIIAVYAHDGFEHMGSEHWFYGTKVFFKSWRNAKSLDGIYLNDSYFEVEVWMSQDEKVTVVPRYGYYYLKIS